MTLTHHYVLNKNVVKNITREIILVIRLDNIEKAFHLPILEEYYRISYESVDQ